MQEQLVPAGAEDDTPVLDPTTPHAGARNPGVFWAIAARRSVKRYLPRPVEIDKLLQIAQAGALAPSSGNIQNWSFIIITDVERIRELYHHTLDQEAFLSAPAAILVVGDENEAHHLYGLRGKKLYTVQNCAAATQNLLLAATALGLGSSWVGAFDEDKIATMFDLPPNARAQAIVLVGYTEVEPESKDRKPLDSVVFFNTWGNRTQRPHLIFYDWATEWRLQAQRAKAHAKHFAARTSLRRHERAEQVAKAKETATQAAIKAKDRMRAIIDDLKKEEYRARR